MHTSTDCPIEVSRIGGLTQSRDCMNNCFAGNEKILGDGICDNGFTGFLLECPLWNYDIDDCVATALDTTAQLSIVNCLHTCPPGNHERFDCSRCRKIEAMGKDFKYDINGKRIYDTGTA